MPDSVIHKTFEALPLLLLLIKNNKIIRVLKK